MNKLAILLSLILPLFITAQNNINYPKHGVGFIMRYDGYNGLSTGVNYEHRITPRSYLSVGAETNFQFNKGINLGYKYAIINRNRFEFLVGVEGSLNNYQWLDQGRNYKSISGLLEARYKVSDHIWLSAGFKSHWYYIHKSYQSDNSHKLLNLINTIQVGAMYRF